MREIIRSIQVARQDADLDITARIVLGLQTKSDLLYEIITANRAKICEEVLATEICESVPKAHKTTSDIDGQELQITFKVI